MRIVRKTLGNEAKGPYLDDSIGDLGTGYDGVCAHHPVGVFLTNLGNEERSHTSTGTTSERVSDLET